MIPRWWQSPLVVVVWGMIVCAGYAMFPFPTPAAAALIAVLVWSAGVLVWMWLPAPQPPVVPLPSFGEGLSPREEHLLRSEWWLNHGCDVPALYGDDGEMACNACGLDFKRMPLDELAQRVGEIRLERGMAIGGAIV